MVNLYPEKLNGCNIPQIDVLDESDVFASDKKNSWENRREDLKDKLGWLCRTKGIEAIGEDKFVIRGRSKIMKYYNEMAGIPFFREFIDLVRGQTILNTSQLEAYYGVDVVKRY